MMRHPGTQLERLTPQQMETIEKQQNINKETLDDAISNKNYKTTSPAFQSLLFGGPRADRHRVQKAQVRNGGILAIVVAAVHEQLVAHHRAGVVLEGK
jgi:hypothetical protein